MNAKYIVMKYSPLAGETMFIFPKSVPHIDFAHAYSQPIVSAGFVTLRNEELFCHGESLSLGLQSRPAEDGILANIMFRRD